MNYNWISILGKYERDSDGFIFIGGEYQGSNGMTLYHVGNFICDQYFGGGVIEGEIEFFDKTDRESCEFILYYDPSTKGFISAGLGGNGSFCSIRSYTGDKFVIHSAIGLHEDIKPRESYKIKIEVIGSRANIKVNGIEIIRTNLPTPIPLGQAGIWCLGKGNIKIRNYKVNNEKGKVFVVMQFTDKYNELYKDVIIPVCSTKGLQVIRADEVTGPGIILSDIAREINDSRIVIAEITPANPNVYYEVGYSHAMNKPTILIAEKTTQLPFDVSPFRVIFYDNTIGGKARIVEELNKHIESIIKQY